MSNAPVTIELGGKEYPLVWGNLARHRYASLPREIREAGGLVPDLTILWASIAAKPNPFPTWEHLAELVGPDDFQRVADALVAVLPSAPTDEKKSDSTPTVSPESNSG